MKNYQRIICLAIVFLAMIFAVSGLTSAQNSECPDCSDVAQCNETPCVRNLIAGQHYDSGDVVVWNNESHLFVKYDTGDNWCLEETQVSVNTSLDDIPQTNNGIPIPGQFGYRNDSHGCIDNFTYEIPLNEISLNDCDTVYILTHANVSRLNPDENEDPDETAWGEGEDFGGNRWAYYFCYTIAPTASIGDYVWNDLDNNGTQNDGNTGIPGVPVELYDCDAGTIISTTTTNGTGYYSFTNLEPGNYSVNFTAPPGFEFTIQNAGNDNELDSDVNNVTGNTSCIMLDEGENNNTIDAGLYETVIPEDKAAIGDRVWEDLDGNGIQCCGEPGIDNVTVELYYCNGTPVATNNTNEEGFYQFTDLNPNEQYYVNFSLPSGYEFTAQNVGTDETIDSDANVTTGNTSCISLISGEYNDTVDAGMYQPASIGDYVWEDVNGDGVQNDGDTGIDNVTVNLYNCNGDLLETTKTNESGYYNFTGLAPGDYYINFIAPSGYEFTILGKGANYEDSDANPSGNTTCVTLTSGGINNDVDAGLYQPASIGDFVWNDQNVNGTQDNGEPGITGVLVKLYECDTGDEIANTTTNGTGYYNFTNLAPGEYYVNFIAPPEFEFTLQDQGVDDTLDSDANNTTGNTSCITLSSGENNVTIDAGLYEIELPNDKAAIGDRVWLDLDKDGIQDEGEPSIENVIVELYYCNGTFVNSTTTDSNGFYLFTDLNPNSYYLNFLLPEGYNFTSPNQGGDSSADSDANISLGNTSCVRLKSGEYNNTLDAGLIFELSPEIDIEKYTNGQDADNPSGPLVQIGTQVTWTYNVTNTGNVNLTDVNITDSKGVTLNCPKTTLNVSESMICTATGNAKLGQYSNYGNVTAMYDGSQVNDSDPSHYFGYDHWAGVPTANPMLLVGVLGIAMLLFIRREQNKK
ncbi:conserved repeat domain protein [Methanohalobium evestigatum Z-7303]|uniref:Conserved repeat domain protein n=1 Tax=Methanohalobium evestigatum (strain ATCC BAA-1072 / DSM 3721 / NBRC 107634 / OCM 161 / Z-7303) TaxID=644295 RepID=D7EAX6_METEZ|nr:SdrD B-like domain-containing protein [Methanohalobium evestigatum]ADI74493.1 conserved repeat domain protein [Methanohalobium evestigatum Z-7303]